MENPTYIALSDALALERQMDVLANNIANQTTTGFKAERMVFAELVADTPAAERLSYVQDAGTVRDLGQGPLTSTGNPLDVALQGAGFLEVQTAAGIRYTRDGGLRLDNQGQVVTNDGDAVLSDGGQPILVPAGAGDITIGQDGTIATRQGTLGRRGVGDFADPEALAETAHGLYATDEAPQPAADVKVVQGMLEGSNTQPVLEMTRFIAAARAIGTAKTFLDGESDRQNNAIQRLGKVV